jgi:hypothetical protein
MSFEPRKPVGHRYDFQVTVEHDANGRLEGANIFRGKLIDAPVTWRP